jgi:hypothetical protein
MDRLAIYHLSFPHRISEIDRRFAAGHVYKPNDWLELWPG